MRLADLAAGVPDAVVEAGADYEVGSIRYDSRQAGPGDLFVAMAGLHSDGHDFAAAAAGRGAAICIIKPVPVAAATPRIRVPDTRPALAELAATLLGRPARRLRVAGVTGTDGKTTTTHIAGHILEHAGRRAGSMSTVAFRVGPDETYNQSGQTTIEAPEVQAWLARMVAGGVEYAVIEATSHALVQHRVGACDFDVAAFTNVGFDHLDYHRTWDDYLEAKARLIDLAATAAPKGLPKTAVLNRDDISWERLSQRPIGRRWSYSIDNQAEIRAVDTWGDANGSRFHLLTPEGEADVEFRLPARFNVYNALCAAGVCMALGLTVAEVAAGLSTFRGVAGRLEPIEMGQDFKVYIDFAHSAGALASALRELRPFASGRLIAVFGSTARSDHDRPGMGRAAAEGADYFLITTDDPLDEDPFAIAADVQAGVVGREAPRDYAIVLDRRRAIRDAIAMARPGDVVLLAGKGHERTMLTAAGQQPWDERAEAEAAIRAVLRS